MNRELQGGMMRVMSLLTVIKTETKKKTTKVTKHTPTPPLMKGKKKTKVAMGSWVCVDLMLLMIA